jgi:CMP-N-acetylneuraminic acid synthetase
MRHVSRRVPGKNFRSFAGRPLYHHIMRSLLDCPSISRVVIDTDSPTICADAAREFPYVQIIDRPARLRDEHTSMNDVLLHTTSQVPAELYLQTHSTNPLLKSETISRAMDEFADSIHDSLFSVTRLNARLWDRDARALNHDPAVLLRTQDLPPVFIENSCIYLFSRESLTFRPNQIRWPPPILS